MQVCRCLIQRANDSLYRAGPFLPDSGIFQARNKRAAGELAFFVSSTEGKHLIKEAICSFKVQVTQLSENLDSYLPSGPVSVRFPATYRRHILTSTRF